MPNEDFKGETIVIEEPFEVVSKKLTGLTGYELSKEGDNSAKVTLSKGANVVRTVEEFLRREVKVKADDVVRIVSAERARLQKVMDPFLQS